MTRKQRRLTLIGSSLGVLALAIGLGACLNAALLYRGLRSRGFYHPQPGWARFSGRLAVALAALAAVLWFAMGPESWWLSASGTLRVAAMGGMVMLGAGVYFAALWLMGFRIADFHRRAA